MPIAVRYTEFAFSRFFFFNDTATTEIYTLSLHDALPILHVSSRSAGSSSTTKIVSVPPTIFISLCWTGRRSEEHTSELQSQSNLVCRLLLEKKNLSRSARLRPLDAKRQPLKDTIYIADGC